MAVFSKSETKFLKEIDKKHSGVCEYIEWKTILPGTHHYDQTIKYSY